MPKFKPAITHDEAREMVNEWHNKDAADKDRITVDDTEWWYSQKGSAALRKYALDLAMKMGGYEAQRCDDLIDDAIKIEAYLRGELADPNS